MVMLIGTFLKGSAHVDFPCAGIFKVDGTHARERVSERERVMQYNLLLRVSTNHLRGDLLPAGSACRTLSVIRPYPEAVSGSELMAALVFFLFYLHGNVVSLEAGGAHHELSRTYHQGW
jgi:hypothetical protein